MITIYHNPRCGKSREALAFLQNNNLEVEIIKYLEQPLTTEQIKSILEKLNLEPIDIVRTKEKVWIENYKGKSLSNSDIIKALVQNPILIERPIVINNEKATIARIIEKLKNIL